MHLDPPTFEALVAADRAPCPECSRCEIQLRLTLQSSEVVTGDFVGYMSVSADVFEREVRRVRDSDFGTATESAFVDGRGPDGSEVVRIRRDASDFRNADADLASDGTLRFCLDGRPSRKEHRELRAAAGRGECLNEMALTGGGFGCSGMRNRNRESTAEP